MRQPDEIKKGLECCFSGRIGRCEGCPYRGLSFCNTIMGTNAVFLVRQLEAQVPRWISAKEPPKEWRKNDKEKVLINYLVYMPEYGVDVGNWVAPAGKWVVMGIPANVTHYMPLPEGPKEGE